MIDFHCHLDLYPDPERVISRAHAEGIYILSVTTTPRAFPMMRRLTRNMPRILVGLGLHPELVSTRHAEADLFPVLLGETDYVGEVGIDGSPAHKRSIALQERVFTKILEHCAASGGRLLSIHSRAAATRVLDCLEKMPKAGTPIFHWFSGSVRELDRAISLGAWFSVGPAMLRSKKGRHLVELMPSERVITETDGPFARSGNSPLYPWDVSSAEGLLSQIWCKDRDQSAELVRANLLELSKLRVHRAEVVS